MNRKNEIDVKDFVKQQQKTPMLRKDVEYLKTKEYAALVKHHHVTVTKWLEEGKIEGAFKQGRQWRIPVQV